MKKMMKTTSIDDVLADYEKIENVFFSELRVIANSSKSSYLWLETHPSYTKCTPEMVEHLERIEDAKKKSISE